MSNDITVQQLLDDIINGRPLPSPEAIAASLDPPKRPAKIIPATAVQVVKDVAINEHGGAGNAVFDNPELFVDMAEQPQVPDKVTPVAGARPMLGSVPKSGGNGLVRPVAPVSVHDLADPAYTPPDPEKIFVDQDVPVSRIVVPEFKVDELMGTLDLRNFATLVTLNTSRWGGKVKDRQASADAATANDAAASAFDTRKNLLAGADAQLKAVTKILDDARTAHYKMTVPWSTTSMEDVGKRSGGRLLPNTLFMDYTTVMAHKRQEMQAALDAFIPAYPTLIEEAKKQLGKRFDPREYPNAESIRSHFILSFDFQPIPRGDDFKGLAQRQVEMLAAKLNHNLQKMTKNAMEDLWVRMHEAVAKVAERLASPDKIFHVSTIQNLKDIARLAGHLNVTGDPRVERIRKKIETHLCQATPEDLRKNGVLRAATAAHAKSILEEMSS